MKKEDQNQDGEQEQVEDPEIVGEDEDSSEENQGSHQKDKEESSVESPKEEEQEDEQQDMQLDEESNDKVNDEEEESVKNDGDKEDDQSEDVEMEGVPAQEELKEQRSFPYLNEEVQADRRHDQMQLGLHQVDPESIQASPIKKQESVSSIESDQEEEEVQQKPASRKTSPKKSPQKSAIKSAAKPSGRVSPVKRSTAKKEQVQAVSSSSSEEESIKVDPSLSEKRPESEDLSKDNQAVGEIQEQDDIDVDSSEEYKEEKRKTPAKPSAKKASAKKASPEKPKSTKKEAVVVKQDAKEVNEPRQTRGAQVVPSAPQ